MRVNVDERALRDPRVVILARALGVTRHHALGQLLDVWALCYDRVSGTVVALDVDTIAERDGFADAMCGAGLAESLADGLIRVAGVAGRIDYLERAKERGQTGGRKASNLRREKRMAMIPAASPKPYTPIQPSFSFSSSSSPRVIAPTALSSFSSSEPVKKKPRCRDPIAPADREIAERVLAKITTRTGVVYGAHGGDVHVALIAARLRDGCTERELRAVIGYCWSEDGGLGWATATDGNGSPMSKYLRPETLFGPRKIAQYLPPAVAWADKLARDSGTGDAQQSTIIRTSDDNRTVAAIAGAIFSRSAGKP